MEYDFGHTPFYLNPYFHFFFLYSITMKDNNNVLKLLLKEGETIMNIRIEIENKELYAHAELYEEMGVMEACAITNQVSRNMSIKSKNFSMSNTRDEENNKIIGEMEINADFLIKIIRKLSPIISACKMVWGLVVNLFEDIAEDIGDEDEWEIEMEDDNRCEEDLGGNNTIEESDSSINE